MEKVVDLKLSTMRSSMKSSEILENYVYLISFTFDDPSGIWMLMDDNAPPHRSKLVGEYKIAGIKL